MISAEEREYYEEIIKQLQEIRKELERLNEELDKDDR